MRPSMIRNAISPSGATAEIMKVFFANGSVAPAPGSYLWVAPPVGILLDRRFIAKIDHRTLNPNLRYQSLAGLV